MLTILFIFTTIWLVLYNSTFSKMRTRYFTLVAVFARIFSIVLFSKIVSTDNTAKNVKWMFAFNALIFVPLQQAYLITPAAMVFAKCVPHAIEGLMMGLVNTVVKLNSEIIARLVGLLFLRNNHISIEEYEGLSASILRTNYLTLLTLFVIRYLIDRNEYMGLQLLIEKVDQMSCDELQKINLSQKEEIATRYRRNKSKKIQS